MIGFLVGCENHRPRDPVVVREERTIVERPARAPYGPGDAAPGSTANGGAAAELDTEDDAAYFHDELVSYGRWIDVEEYGPCWQPYDCPPGWRPYLLGRWAFTDDFGWLWLSDEPFGWCCYHYGRWAFVARFGWCWVPGREWGAAWVSWRHGGGYIGWCSLPPVRSGLTVGIDVELGEPPHWGFCFVEEKHITEVDLREHIVPVTRNVTLVNVTKNITKYEVVNGRVVNRGLDVREVERVTGRPVPRHQVTEVSDHGAAGVRGNQIAVYRPKLPPRPARAAAGPARPAGSAMPAAGGRRSPSRFVPADPRAETPAQVEARQRELETYHERLGEEMRLRHARELEQLPPGGSTGPVLAQHRKALQSRPRTLRRREGDR